MSVLRHACPTAGVNKAQPENNVRSNENSLFSIFLENFSIPKD